MDSILPAIIEQRRLPSPTPTPQALAWHLGALWLGSRDERRVFGINVPDWTVFEETPVEGIPWAAASAGDALYFTSGEDAEDDRYLRRYLPGTGFDASYRVAQPEFTGSYLSHEGGSFYLSQWYKHRVLQLDPDGNVLRTIEIGAEISGHTFAGGDFYVLRGTEQDGESWHIARLDLGAETPQAVDIARVPFACRSLAFDGRSFWTNHRAQNETVCFTLPDPPPAMNDLPLRPSLEEFLAVTARGDANLIAVSAELMADCETPVTAFQKLLDDDPGGEDSLFLLESAENSEQIGRYSFLGNRPAAVFESRGHTVTVTEQGGARRQYEATRDPLAELQAFLARYRPAPVEPALPFGGGAVGYLGYDAVRWFEGTVPPHRQDELDLPEMVFLVTDTMIVFDHRFRRLRVMANVFTEGRETDLLAAYAEARAKITRLVRRLRAPSHLRPGLVYRELPTTPAPASNTTREEYEAAVERGKEYIRAGDIFQFVPSQRFETAYAGDALSLYRALRFINPSPYMFLLRFGGRFALVGSSPEVHVRAQDGAVEIRPIAGTRPRGKDAAEDRALAESLLADPKERAEHLMLVDLARNDVGRIAEFGSVRVTDFMTVERYSHVMHIVSNVQGRLRAGQNAFDVMRATFPAGTVSGSPKVRAMQIINELEKSKRGFYAGAVGYFGFDGNLDSCITLRSVVLKDGQAYVQAGAGVVADSVAASEYEETVNKARGMIRAIELARHIGGEL